MRDTIMVVVKNNEVLGAVHNPNSLEICVIDADTLEEKWISTSMLVADVKNWNEWKQLVVNLHK